jgi:hypothetical protein
MSNRHCELYRFLSIENKGAHYFHIGTISGKSSATHPGSRNLTGGLTNRLLTSQELDV